MHPTNTHNPRFVAYRDAFFRMVGRSEATIRAGNSRRAYLQCLAANRLFKLALQYATP